MLSSLFSAFNLEISSDSIPEHTVFMNFRHLLAHQIFKEVSTWLSDAGILVKEGTLMGASILEAASYTDNKAGERDLEMQQTKKGNQCFYPDYSI